MNPHFTLLSLDEQTSARRAQVHTARGTIETPAFMPVGTQATVKSMQPRDLESIGAQIILGNTYHLNLRPGSELIQKLGGLHTFMGWERPILTDSGGFQVFSLANLRKLSDEGVRFRSHIDGREVIMTPRGVLDIQRNLGSDIAMVLDQCPPAACPREEAEVAVRRTLDWARVSRDYALESNFAESGQVFGIVQGGRFADLRKRCAEELAAMDFPGYAVGGVSVGEPEEEMLPQVEVAVASLPAEKARYVMGVGTPPQLLRMVALGADMFDCVMPSREARHGSAFTPWGKINIKNNRFKEDDRPLVEGLDNITCQKFSRAYLRHLVTSGEILGSVLLTLHNLHFFLDLMRQAREHIELGDFGSWSSNWIERYRTGDLAGEL